jgi:hypothetical protein
MKHILFIVVLFAFSFSGLRAQDHIPQAKKIMGLFNEESSWSPDGEKISFDHAAQGECDIFLVHAPKN